MNKACRMSIVIMAVLFMISPIFSLSDGNSIPPISLKLMSGAFVGLKGECKSGAVVLSFFHHECQPCMNEIPHLQALAQKHPKLKVYLVADIATNAGLATGFLEKVVSASGVAITLPVAIDKFGDVKNAFAVTKHPTTFLINSQGKIVSRDDGYTEEKGKALAERIKALLK